MTQTTLETPDGTTRAFAAIHGAPSPDCIDTDFVSNEESRLHIIGLAEYDIWEVEIRLIRKVSTNPEHFPGDLS